MNSTPEEEIADKERFFLSLGLMKTPVDSSVVLPEVSNMESGSLDTDEFEAVQNVIKMSQDSGKFSCSECNRNFRGEASFKIHNISQHKKVDVEDDYEDSDIHFGSSSNPKGEEVFGDQVAKFLSPKSVKRKFVESSQRQNSSNPRKLKTKSVEKKKGNPKLIRSLREDELKANKIFAENIEVRESYFYCKICSKFSTTTKLLAKVHVTKCGKYKKKGRPTKKSECPQCSEMFSSIKEMHKHHFEEQVHVFLLNLPQNFYPPAGLQEAPCHTQTAPSATVSSRWMCKNVQIQL